MFDALGYLNATAQAEFEQYGYYSVYGVTAAGADPTKVILLSLNT